MIKDIKHLYTDFIKFISYEIEYSINYFGFCVSKVLNPVKKSTTGGSFAFDIIIFVACI